MPLPVDRRARGALSPRMISAIVSAWVFVSAFAWHHAPRERANTWIAGLVCLFLSVAGTAIPWARYATAVAALWLFVSAWVLPSESLATAWSNVLSAIAIFVMSFVPGETRCERPTGTFGGRRAA